jgi:hypothetical protein
MFEQTHRSSMTAKVLMTGAAALALAACGKIDVQETQQDAPVQHDASIDISLIDAALTANINVVTRAHVLNSMPGSTAPMTVVYSSLPNATVQNTTMTDANGSGTIAVYPGGSVTAVYPHNVDGGYDFASYYGVKDGDTLTFGQPTTLTSPSTVETVTLSWTPVSTPSFYEIFTPCGYYGEVLPPATTAVVTLNDNCAAAPAQFMIEEFPTTGSDYFSYGALSTVTSGSSASLAMSAFVVNPSTTTLTGSLTGLPSEIATASCSAQTIATNTGTSFASYTCPSVNVTGSAATLVDDFNPGDGHTLVETSLRRTGSYQNMIVYDGEPANVTSWAVTTPNLPPWMNVIGSSAPDGKVAWFTLPTTGTSAANGIVVRLRWSHVITMGGPSVPFTWTVVLPPDVTSFTVPTLPMDFAIAQPMATDSFTTNVEYFLIPSLAAGYDSFRSVPERDLVSPDYGARLGDYPRVIVSGN